MATVFLHGAQAGIQQGDIVFQKEIDRIYLYTSGDVGISDPGNGRGIRNAKSGSTSMVLWNPSAAKAKRMSDFSDDESLEMVCVETANAGSDSITIAPSDSHVLAASIGLISPSG